MLKRLPVILTIILCSACTKNTKTACGTQVCTALFASVGIHFIDKDGSPVAVTDFTVINLRTNKTIIHAIPEGLNNNAGYKEVVDDNDIKSLSTDGDNLQVSATNPNGNQTKTVVLKIAGGCNCHVTKVSGPDSLQFD